MDRFLLINHVAISDACHILHFMYVCIYHKTGGVWRRPHSFSSHILCLIQPVKSCQEEEEEEEEEEQFEWNMCAIWIVSVLLFSDAVEPK